MLKLLIKSLICNSFFSILRSQATEDDNLTEIANHVYGDVLTENPDVARSAFGPHRVVPDRWKGMNQDQLEVIKNTQVQVGGDSMILQLENFPYNYIPHFRNLDKLNNNINKSKAKVCIRLVSDYRLI